MQDLRSRSQTIPSLLVSCGIASVTHLTITTAEAAIINFHASFTDLMQTLTVYLRILYHESFIVYCLYYYSIIYCGANVVGSKIRSRSFCTYLPVFVCFYIYFELNEKINFSRNYVFLFLLFG